MSKLGSPEDDYQTIHSLNDLLFCERRLAWTFHFEPDFESDRVLTACFKPQAV